MENNELQHWGIKGQKWGVRRYQNSDGTLTAAGKKRYNKELAKLREEKKVLENKRKTQAKIDKLDAMRKEIDDIKSGKKPAAESGKKSIKDMTDEELTNAINRARLEKDYRDTHPEVVTRGQRFINKLKDGAVDKSADLAINIGHDYIDKVARDTLGLNKKDDMSESEKLAQKLKDLKNQKEIDELNDSDYQKLKRESSMADFNKKIRESEKTKADAEKARVEADKAKSEADKAKAKSEEDNRVYEGEVVGEGTSKANKTKSGPTVDVTVSNVPATVSDADKKYVDDFLKRFKYSR